MKYHGVFNRRLVAALSFFCAAALRAEAGNRHDAATADVKSAWR